MQGLAERLTAFKGKGIGHGLAKCNSGVSDFLSSTEVTHHSLDTGSDDSANVAWCAKGSMTTTSTPAHLLRMKTMHQRHCKCHSSDFFMMSGPSNIMAGTCLHCV